MQLSRLVLAIFMAFMLVCAGTGAQARLLRGGVAGAPGRALLKDAKDAGVAADSWGGRDWPATRQVAYTSARGSVAPSSRAYAYSTSATPIMMSGAMNAPIMDSWGGGYRG